MNIQTSILFIQAAESIATILALIIGAIWTYKLFIQNRQKYPRANLHQEITHFKLPDNKFLIHVSLIIENIGNVLIQVQSIEVRLLQVFPFPPENLAQVKKCSDATDKNQSEIDWPQLDCKQIEIGKTSYEIEPGEIDVYHFDFIVKEPVNVVEIYSHVVNIKKKKKDIGWTCTILHELFPISCGNDDRKEAFEPNKV